jgi:recombination protein RecT
MSTEKMNAPARPKEAETLKSLLARPATIERLADIAPKYLSPDRLIRILLLTVSRDSKLWRCTPQSMLSALMRVAQFGLEPDGRLVHLVPYKDTVNVIIDWKGLIEIARRNGMVAVAELVYEKDHFEFGHRDGRQVCNHIPHFEEDRGNIRLAYSCVKRLDGKGDPDYEVMTKSEIDKIRKRSPAGGDGPWVTDYGEMARKTVLRRHSKRWPLCAEDRLATEDDDVPEDVRLRREVASEPARPVFTRSLASREVDDDDLQYGASDTPKTESETKEEPKAPETSQLRRKTKVESEPVQTATQEQPLENPLAEKSLQDQLKTWVEVEMKSNFETFKVALVELGWSEKGAVWNSFNDVPLEDAAKLLNSHKIVSRAMQMVKGGAA